MNSAIEAEVKIEAWPRIHICLIDLGRTTMRAFGGLGVFLDGLSTRVEVRPGPLALDQEGLAGESYLAATLLLQRMREKFSAINGRLRVIQSAPLHLGLGSKTTLLLSLVKALDTFNALELSDAEIVAITGRGGASGVGVNGFFTGGLIADAGHPQERVAELLPSSMSSRGDRAPVVCREHVPSTWRVHLFDPQGKAIHAGDEEQLFRESAPIPADEVMATLAAVYHGVIPSILTEDSRGLASALRAVHSVGFKKRELMVQTETVRNCFEFLSDELQVPAGMSSVGPLVYAWEKICGKALLDFSKEAKSRGYGYLGAYLPRNGGFVTSIRS